MDECANQLKKFIEMKKQVFYLILLFIQQQVYVQLHVCVCLRKNNSINLCESDGWH